MGANIAGIYGAQIFRQDDRPRYRRAFGVCIGVLVAGVVLAIVRYLDVKLRRRRNGKQTQSHEDIGDNVPADDNIDARSATLTGNDISSPVAPANERRLSSYGAAVERI